MSIEVRNLVKKYGDYTAIDNVSFDVKQGELIAILGPSGCGKTTLLRTVAGLESSESGEILLNGKETSDLSPKERNVGFVFQHFALFKHMTVFDNVAFGLTVKPKKDRLPNKEIEERVRELLKLVQMDWAEKRYPTQLSGGQRQRIALARALAIRPSVLLLDEPFSALDAKVRKELRKWLRKLHDDLNITTLFVTHDQEEALELADKIVIVNKGKLEQIGTPEEVYENPVSPFVYSFIGNVNVFHSRFDGCLIKADNVKEEEIKEKAFVRPHDVKISKKKEAEDDIKGVVRDIRILRSYVYIEIECLDVEGIVEAEVERQTFMTQDIKKGDEVFVKLKNVKFFDKDSYVI